MASRIEEIESRIIFELKRSPLSSYCNTFEIFDWNTGFENLNRFKGKLPACLVSYIGDHFQEVTHGSTYMDNMDISVLVVANEIRDKGKEKGIHSMLEDVKNALHKSHLFKNYLDLPVILKERAPIEMAQNLAVYALLFEVQFPD